ncbi:unannotated protein [freshwater metagenome]|uniref:Unannotated protein n=1 Tax=freshwater metagenome TaxID=449393 RepID=A0A6J7RRB0_9ZZZZ
MRGSWGWCEYPRDHGDPLARSVAFPFGRGPDRDFPLEPLRRHYAFVQGRGLWTKASVGASSHQ